MAMGWPARRGNAQLLLLLLVAGLHLSGAQSPAPSPSPSPVVVIDAPAPLSVPAVAVHPPPVPAAVASPFSFSFDFTDSSYYRHDDLKFEGDAAAQLHQVDLTSCDSSDCKGVGRVSYGHPVPFYDSTTGGGGGEMASFQTRFTFGILSNNNNAKGEGMAFFLGYFSSTLPGNSYGGSDGGLGLTLGDGAALGINQFVAVEFDTLENTWDPIGDHIGIDINSVASNDSTPSSAFNLSGYMMATITFESTTRMLAADLQFVDHDGNYLPDQVLVSKELPDTLSSLLPAQVAVGFSAATSSGSGSGMERHQILSWSFNSSLALPHEGQNMKAAFIGSSVGGAVALVVVVWCILSCFNRRRSTIGHDFMTRTGGPRRFMYRDLAAATDNFSRERVIGRGAFGVVYRGTLISKGSSSSLGVPPRESAALSSMESGALSNPSSKESDGGEVAVKKILNEPRGENLDFFAEMSTIGAAKHKNLVKLKGWCCKENSQNMLDFMWWCCRKKKDDELFLVYELVPNGNLHYHLRESEQVIAWPTRYQIVKDIGSALIYLHHDCAPYILHRDIKPSNILLDNNFNAKLADFGLSRIGNQDNATLLTNAIGTEGYIDPECRKVGKVKFYPSSDVYSFGIVLLDIVCTGKSREQVWELYIKGKVVEAADGRLHGSDDLDKRQMQRVAILGLWCSLRDSSMRPTVRKAMEVLERDEPLPDLNYLVNTSVPSAQQDTYTISSDQHALMSDGS